MKMPLQQWKACDFPYRRGKVYCSGYSSLMRENFPQFVSAV